MATWIAHLRVAEALFAALPHLDETAFMYGNLAPDSGKPNADWTAFDPPKEVTHFLRRGEGEDKIHDLKFYRAYLADRQPDEDVADTSFRLGYFFHLICDNLWSRRLTTTYKRLYPDLIDNPTHPLWTAFKRDWYHLDFCYLRDHPTCLFWRVYMTTPNPPTYMPFVSADGLTYSLDHIRTFYSTPNPERNIDHAYIYLNETTMSRYVEDSVQAILKLYKRLQLRPALDGLNSAVSLLDEDDLTPYEPPLGDVAAI